MKHIMLSAEDVRDLFTKNVTEVRRVRIEMSQGAVDEVLRWVREALDDPRR